MPARIIQANLEYLYWLRLLWGMFLEEKPPTYPDMREALDEFTRSVAHAMQDPRSLLSAFLAFKGHRAIGFIMGEIRHREIGIPHYYGYIHWIYIRPEHRSREVATSLAQAWIEWLSAQRVRSGINGEQPIQVDTVEGSSYYGDDYWKEHGFKPFLVNYVISIKDITTSRDRFIEQKKAVKRV